MKKIKLCLIVVLSICMVLSGVFSSKAVNAEDAVMVNETMSGGEVLEKKYKAKLVDEQIKQMSGTEGISPEKEEAIFSLNDKFGEVDTNSKNPSNYAGVYLNSKNQIVVNVTAKKQGILKKIKKCANGEDITVKKTEYSLNELKQQMKHIENYYKEKRWVASGKDILDSIKAFYIDIEKNAVVVRIKDNNIRKETYIRNKIIGGKSLLFENTDYENKEVTSLSAGQGVFTDLQNGFCGMYSIGFRVWWPLSDGSLMYGFITAGHGTEIGQNVYASTYLSSSNHIGYICNKKYEGNVDASVVAITNGTYNVTNHLYGSSLSLTDRYYFPNLYQGMDVGKIGQTTGYTYGKVTSPSITVITTDGAVISDCFEATNSAQGGDSGGIAFTYSSTENIIGIDGITKSTNGTYTHFVKYMNTYYAFGTNAY